MKRKVVKHGPSTLIISIPSGWAKKYSVKQGDELDVDEQGSRLIIDNKGEKQLPEINMDISGLKPKMIRRFLVNSYQYGYDKINVLYNNPKQCLHIQHKLPELLGYEIIERTNEGCVIKNIAKKIDIDFKNSIKKTFLILNGMIDDLCEGYRDEDKKRMANIHYKDVDINKYTSFCLRMINKETYTGYPSSQIHTIYHIIITLENVADNYKKLSKLLSKFPKDKNIQKILLKLKDYFKQNYEFFYKPDKEKVLNSMKTNIVIRRMIKENLKKTKNTKNLLVLTLLNHITQVTYHLTSKHLIAVKF